MLTGLVVDGVRRFRIGAVDTESSLDHGARGLARTEAGDARATREMANALVDGVLEFLVGDLDLEHDGALVAFADFGVHRILGSMCVGMRNEYRDARDCLSGRTSVAGDDRHRA